MDKMVLVTWVDSLRNSAWEPRGVHASMKASSCSSVGFLLRDDDENIIIYQSWDSDNNSVGMSLTIPKVAVIDVKELRRK